MTKQEAKYYQIAKVLKEKFNWTKVVYEGKENLEAYLHHNGKLYMIYFWNNLLTFSHGEKSKTVDFLCEYNTKEDFVLDQCAKIDIKCRKLISEM